MPYVSSSRGRKRLLADGVVVSEPPSKSSKVTFLSPSLVLLEIPADTNTSLPVWEAMRSQQVDVAWTVDPYSVSVHLTPVTSKQGKSTTSSAAQSLVPSSTIPPPHMVIQSLTQQHGVSQDLRVLLTQLLPSPPCQPQKIPPTPTTATSLIITQPQPAHQHSPSTEKQVLPAIQSPRATPTIQQAPSKVPAPSAFHTKSSPDIRICDHFLLNLCRSGKKCKMHHTPYPFHWQLRCAITRRWIDVPYRSQVSLERIYCNVNQEVIWVKDKHVHYSLDFSSMELDDSSKYEGVRRLTNSESPTRNPYFPSKWKIYWWDDLDWEEYNTVLSTLLLKKMSKKEPECSFYIDSQKYTVDFTSMIQTNVSTEFQREVRCRPFYHSPDSMQPYLQTGMQSEPTQPVSDPPGADLSVDPLEEFSSWYPPVWRLASELDYSLVDVPAGTPAYRSVQSLFCESLPETMVDIISIQQVENLLHWDKYQRHKVYMQKQHGESPQPLERHLFHGTTEPASQDICHNNFDPRMAGLNGTSHGYGSYFAIAASFSNTYSAKTGPDKVRHMFLAKVLVGNVSLGRSNYRRPPPLNSMTRQFSLYDTCVDSVKRPTTFVVFDSCQCYPYYLIKYKDLPKEIDI